MLEKVIITKMQRRILKLAFKRYRDKTKLATWDINGVKKSEDYAFRIIYNSKKRMFRGIKKFAQNHRLAKINFKKVYINSDLRSKKCFFTIWKKQILSEKAHESVSI